MDLKSEINPYEVISNKSVGVDSRHKLIGFARGARNGFLWSLPLVAALTFLISTNGRTPPSLFLALLEALQISVIWGAAAGIVAAFRDRSKSNASDGSDEERGCPRIER